MRVYLNKQNYLVLDLELKNRISYRLYCAGKPKTEHYKTMLEMIEEDSRYYIDEREPTFFEENEIYHKKRFKLCLNAHKFLTNYIKKNKIK